MAKVKTFAVDVEIVVKRTLYVTARRPNGARERVLTEEGWAEALRYQDDDLLQFERKNATVTNVREAGF